MLVKILDFNNHQLITDPLNTQADLYSVSIVNVNDQPIIFLPVVDIDNNKIVTIEYDETLDIEDLHIVADVSTGARYDINLDTNKINVISESNTVENSWSIIWSPVASINKILISKLSENSNIVSTYKNVNNDLSVAYLDYIDNDVRYYDFDVITNFNNTTTKTLISFNGVDPDGDDVFSTVLSPFNTEEQVFLDSAYLHLRLTRTGVDNQYIKLQKSSSIISSYYVEQLQKELSNKWMFSYLDRILVMPTNDSSIDHNLSTKTSVQEIKDYLYNLDIQYWDVRNYWNILIDFTATDQYYEQLYGSLSLKNSIEYNDLMTYGIDYIGKAFAELIHDELILVTPEVLPDVINYLRTIYDATYRESICTETLAKMKVTYLANSGIELLSLLSIRLLKHIFVHLENMLYQQSNKLIFFHVTNVDIEKFIQVVSTMYIMKSSYQYTALSVSNGKEFFRLLEKMIKNDNPIVLKF